MAQIFSNRTILIIDDDDSYSKFLKLLLEKKFKCKVMLAENPKVAFGILTSIIPSLILLDMQMPVMDGHTALTYIRSNENTKNIPVIACTALHDQQIFLSLVKLKIADYIVKPSTVKIIVEKIQKLLLSLPEKGNYAP